MKTILVTGTDTGVGKTWITCTLIRTLNEVGLRTGGYKPVCSGSVLNSRGLPEWADISSIQHACLAAGHSVASSSLTVCPQRFHAPLAPNLAAKLEGLLVDDELLIAGIHAWEHDVDCVVVEGAGGLFCPLSDSTTVLDVAVRLQSPVIVVAANRLGVINHTRLTLNVLAQHHLKVAAIVLNDVQPKSESEPDASRDSNASQLMHWIREIPLFSCGWNQSELRCESEKDLSIVDVLTNCWTPAS